MWLYKTSCLSVIVKRMGLQIRPSPCLLLLPSLSQSSLYHRICSSFAKSVTNKLSNGQMAETAGRNLCALTEKISFRHEPLLEK